MGQITLFASRMERTAPTSPTNSYEQFRQDNPNLRVTPSGDIYTINQNGTETKTGSETYYNEKDKQAAGQIGQFAGPIEFLGLAEFDTAPVRPPLSLP
jgi:hypothetical protein